MQSRVNFFQKIFLEFLEVISVDVLSAYVVETEEGGFGENILEVC